MQLDWLREVAPGVEVIGAATAHEGLALVRSAEALIGWFTPDMLAAARALRWIQLERAGAEGVAGNADIVERGILVTNFRHLTAPVVAEHTLALMLALSRQLPLFVAYQRRGVWAQARVDSRRLIPLHGRSVLVVGLGAIGSAVAERAAGFGMRVLAVRNSGPGVHAHVEEIGWPTDLLRMATSADVVVNTAPLTPATTGVFNRPFFECLRGRDAMFVNVGRGRSVVTKDLLEAVRSGWLAGAAIDVVEPQPLPARHPLWREPNVIVTPHVANWSRSTAARGWALARENLRRYVSGDSMLSIVRVDRGY